VNAEISVFFFAGASCGASCGQGQATYDVSFSLMDPNGTMDAGGGE